MKKVWTMALLAVLILGACEKENTKNAVHQQSRNRVILSSEYGKTGNSIILMMDIGHDGKTCTGCVLQGGQLIHANCMGEGNYCVSSVSVQLQQAGYTINAVTTDTFDLTSEDFFLMPDRSLDYMDDKNNHYYLNIPGQMVYRDSTTLQFTFTGLFFSEAAAYEND